MRSKAAQANRHGQHISGRFVSEICLFIPSWFCEQERGLSKNCKAFVNPRVRLEISRLQGEQVGNDSQIRPAAILAQRLSGSAHSCPARHGHFSAGWRYIRSHPRTCVLRCNIRISCEHRLACTWVSTGVQAEPKRTITERL